MFTSWSKILPIIAAGALLRRACQKDGLPRSEWKAGAQLIWIEAIRACHERARGPGRWVWCIRWVRSGYTGRSQAVYLRTFPRTWAQKRAASSRVLHSIQALAQVLQRNALVSCVPKGRAERWDVQLEEQTPGLVGCLVSQPTEEIREATKEKDVTKPWLASGMHEQTAGSHACCQKCSETFCSPEMIWCWSGLLRILSLRNHRCAMGFRM